ncbi:hypothetical protein V3W47_09400 [Deinococcus sp. YIM 134068]|uniref:hypothetical protein n=1 Tax=Deinococcus lichenicola TaxID=3118910 RepID=UPI002F926BF5
MSSGWGLVENNRSDAGRAARPRRPLTRNGVISARGFGVHTPSQRTSDLEGTFP